MTAALLLVGLAALVAGAELLVRGASRLALAVRVPPLIVGLTVVAFGTSSPELAVSTSAALAGQGDIALGNVIGSNIFNILFILGLAALVAPLVVSSQLVRFDVPVMVVATVLLLWMVSDGTISGGEGVVLLLGLALYVGFLIREGWRSAAAEPVDPDRVRRGAASFAADAAMIAVGLGLLVVGSDWLVDSARRIATALGVSELMIGLTIVAAGTSLPELATSVIAAARGQRDLAVGNVVGSNLFNILGILGVAAVVAPEGLAAPPAAVTFDIPVALTVAAACLPVFAGGAIVRWEGALFIGYYVAYVAYLALDATNHGALPEFRDAMVYFALPLTALTILVLGAMSLRRPS